MSEESDTAAPYCDGTSTAGALAPLIASGAVTLEEETTPSRACARRAAVGSRATKRASAAAAVVVHA